MEYNLHGLPEVFVGVAFFVIVAVGYALSTRKNISDDTRMFR